MRAGRKFSLSPSLEVKGISSQKVYISSTHWLEKIKCRNMGCGSQNGIGNRVWVGISGSEISEAGREINVGQKQLSLSPRGVPFHILTLHKQIRPRYFLGVVAPKLGLPRPLTKEDKSW